MSVPRTLFVGRGKGAVAWYRCALPAMVLEQDWIGVAGLPGDLAVVTGLTGRVAAIREDDFDDYDVLVLQQPAGKEWLQAIRRWQARGIVVLFEVDDWLRGIRRMRHHDFHQFFDKAQVESLELCMAACDGVICSTEWLANRYRGVNPRTFVCRNGLDLKRYELTRPEREEVAIGWAGATGHREGVRPWIAEVASVMREHADTRFISVGQPFAQWLEEEFGAGRALSVPFSPLDTYPAAMTLIDVALAPAGKGSFFRGKSDLRWLEAGALGIPIIADPDVYPEIEHGVTGFHASTPAEMRGLLAELVADRELRDRIGAAAKAYVAEHRSAQVAAQRWAEVLNEVVADRDAAAA
jgi:glycosyltransferase involved in cell wall biosynthesis